MDYDQIVDAVFQPSPAGVVPGPVTHAAPPRRLRDAIEPIAMHSVWCRATNARLDEFGMGFLGRYTWSRAALLGNPDPGVVVASFAVFEPGLITATYDAARATVDRDTLLAARDEATIASLGDVLSGIDVSAVASRLGAAIADADPTGRPLFAGLSRLGWPADPVGRLWRACELAREHRGDSHVAVCVARGVGPVAMNVLTELWVGFPLGTYSATRGWSAEQIGGTVARLRAAGLMDGDEITDAGRAYRDEIEAATDAVEQPIVDALGTGFDADVAALDEWSARCIAARAFPPDVFKRAAG